MTFKYFNPEEDPKIIGLDDGLMLMLDSAREVAGIPFVITCGKRTESENACLHGAVADSAHLKGLAVDLACADDHALERMEYGLSKVGFVRRGIYVKPSAVNATKLLPVHIHVDCDETLPQQYAWVLREQN